MDRFKNHYRALNVDFMADETTIKAAFRRLALRYHPDRATTARATRRFQEIREAYDVLSDPDKRRDYDRLYRVHTALRPAKPSAPPPRKARASSGTAGLGITLDVLGLRVGLAVDAAVKRPAAKGARSQRKKR
jgi:curved DNA-binding protein CbpA